jgi:transcriptional regulator with GAF, ATPase, and Fis domain
LGTKAAAGGTIVRQVQVIPGATRSPARRALRGGFKLGRPTSPPARPKLELLLDLSQRLSGELDHERLLETIVHTAFEVLAVDRVAILLLDAPSGTFVPRLSRSRIGNLPAEAVPAPSSIPSWRARRGTVRQRRGRQPLQRAVDPAPECPSAMCTPLMANAEQVLGILYVDSVTATNSFSEEDLRSSSHSADRCRRDPCQHAGR